MKSVRPLASLAGRMWSSMAVDAASPSLAITASTIFWCCSNEVPIWPSAPAAGLVNAYATQGVLFLASSQAQGSGHRRRAGIAGRSACVTAVVVWIAGKAAHRARAHHGKRRGIGFDCLDQ